MTIADLFSTWMPMKYAMIFFCVHLNRPQTSRYIYPW